MKDAGGSGITGLSSELILHRKHSWHQLHPVQAPTVSDLCHSLVTQLCRTRPDPQKPLPSEERNNEARTDLEFNFLSLTVIKQAAHRHGRDNCKRAQCSAEYRLSGTTLSKWFFTFPIPAHSTPHSVSTVQDRSALPKATVLASPREDGIGVLPG